MKVKLLKDLPEVEAGSELVKEGDVWVFHALSQKIEFTDYFILKNPDWFEIIKEPVWAKEEWIVEGFDKDIVEVDIHNVIFKNTIYTQGRENLVQKAPDMWRLLDEISKSQIHEMHDKVVEAKELLEQIQ